VAEGPAGFAEPLWGTPAPRHTHPEQQTTCAQKHAINLSDGKGGPLSQTSPLDQSNECFRGHARNARLAFGEAALG
jgi:hypothetical protein